MECLEDALVDGLPAQSPKSHIEEIRKAIVVSKAQITSAVEYVVEADALTLGG